MISSVTAIATTTFRHCVRSRALLLGVAAYVAAMALCVVLAPASPARATAPEGEVFDAERATLSPGGERIRFIQSASVGLAFFFGAAITALVAATWLPAQIKGGELGQVLSKPVGRVSAVLGTLVGFWLLLALLYALYAAVGAAALRLAASSEEARRQLQTIHMTAASEFGELGSAASPAQVRLASPGQAAFWRFDASGFAGDAFRCQFIGEIQKSDNPFVDHADLLVSVRDARSGSLLRRIKITNVKSMSMTEFSLPRSALPEGAFDIAVSPAMPDYLVVCYPKGFGIITGASGFEWNYAKTFALSLIGLTVFLALALLGSTLLSQNVSIFFSVGAGMAGAAVNFLREYTRTRYIPTALSAPVTPAEGIHPYVAGLRTAAGALGESASASFLQAAGELIETIIFGAAPDWSRFDGARHLLNRISVPAGAFGSPLLYASIYCAVCVVLAGIIFGRRELK